MEATIAELGKRTHQYALPPESPQAPSGEMPEVLLTRNGLVWLKEPDPLGPRQHRELAGG